MKSIGRRCQPTLFVRSIRGFRGPDDGGTSAIRKDRVGGCFQCFHSKKWREKTLDSGERGESCQRSLTGKGNLGRPFEVYGISELEVRLLRLRMLDRSAAFGGHLDEVGTVFKQLRVLLQKGFQMSCRASIGGVRLGGLYEVVGRV